MPTVLESPPVRDEFLPPRKKWTRAELDKLESLNLLDASHLELVEGDLFSLMGKNRPHSDFVTLLFHYLSQIFEFRSISSESPIEVALADREVNQPQPDLFVTRRQFRGFREAIPGVEDLSLVIEVADSSFAFDLTTKAALYARAGIVEYWVVDIQGRRLFAHRQPEGGSYLSVKVYGPHEQILPLESPGGALDLKKIFDPEA